VHALGRQRIEIDGERGDQRLAFAGLHLGDHPAMQHDAAHQLDIEMALPQRALGRLAHRGEGVDQHVVEALSGDQPAAQPGGALGEILVAQRLEAGLQVIDRRHDGAEALDVAIVGRAKNPLGERGEHRNLGWRWIRPRRRRRGPLTDRPAAERLSIGPEPAFGWRQILRIPPLGPCAARWDTTLFRSNASRRPPRNRCSRRAG